MGSEDDNDKTIFTGARPRPETSRPPMVQRQGQGQSEPPDEKTLVYPAKRRAGRAQRPAAPVLTLSGATRKKVRIGNSATNPLISNASGILTLLGRLRTGRIEQYAAPLRDHLRQALRGYSAALKEAGIPAREADTAQYLLAAACDDIVRNLPDADPQTRDEPGLAEELFADERSGVGFFTRLHRAGKKPKQQARILELGLICLAVGFQGQYRRAADGSVALTAMRHDLHESLRKVSPVPYTGLSQDWEPSAFGKRRSMALMPLWMIAGIAAMMVVALFSVLAWTLTKDTQAAQARMALLQGPPGPYGIKRVAIPDAPGVQLFVPPPTSQADRIRAQLAPLLASGETLLSTEGDYLVFRLGEALEFRPGAAELKSEASAIAGIAAVLEAEPGPIIVEGHSDNIPLSGRGAYKTNEALSEARAAAVRDVLARYLSDPLRLQVVGAGPVKPLDRADTPEARARNRRVDILLLREDRQ
jgi:type VI secretion system protein ImpK